MASLKLESNRRTNMKTLLWTPCPTDNGFIARVHERDWIRVGALELATDHATLTGLFEPKPKEMS